MIEKEYQIKAIESWMVLLKISFLSMERAVGTGVCSACAAAGVWRIRSRYRFDFGMLAIVLGFLLIFTACASSANRKRQTAMRSEQSLVEPGSGKRPDEAMSLGVGGSQTQSAPLPEIPSGSESAKPHQIDVLPIGPDEVQRFPFLAPYRGFILLVKGRLFVVVDAQQLDWVQGTPSTPDTSVTATGLPAQNTVKRPAQPTILSSAQSVAHIPLVTAVFNIRPDGKALRNIAAESVGIAIDCQHACDGGAARAAFRLSGLAEYGTNPGASGLSTGLIMRSGGVESPVAQIRVFLADVGPALGVEIDRPLLPNAQLRFAIEPKSSGPGTILVVSEDHFVEGGDASRLSYAQGLVATSQYLVLPGSDSHLLIDRGLPIAAHRIRKGPQKVPDFESDFLPSGFSRIRVLPGEGARLAKTLIFTGEEATQNGFKYALDRELGDEANSVLDGLVFTGLESMGENITDAPSSYELRADVRSAGLITNESGDPLLMAMKSEGLKVKFPTSRFGSNEKLNEVTFDLSSGIPADIVAVVPIGSAREQRQLLMQASTGEGVTVISRGVVAASRWPVQMRLPNGVYEAFYLARGKGILCRVPFDVSRQRENSATSPVRCGPATRSFSSGTAKPPLRLASLDDVGSRSFLPAALFSIRNERLDLEFKVAPTPSSSVREIFQRLGDSEHDFPETPGLGSAWAPRSVVFPCSNGDGLTALLKSVRIALQGAINFFPFYSCGDSRVDAASLDTAEAMKNLGLKVLLLPPLVSSLLEQRLSLIDRLFAWEPLFRQSTAAPGEASAGDYPPPSLGRAGTFIEVTGMRRLDSMQVEATIRIGRTARGLRYLETPWRPYRLHALSGGKIIGGWQLEPERSEYKLTFRVAARIGSKQTGQAVRFLVTGKMDGIVAYLFQASGEFPVASTQFLELPG
jgi:hypothetical protein